MSVERAKAKATMADCGEVTASQSACWNCNEHLILPVDFDAFALF